MSSLVTELLSSAGQLAKDDLKSEIAKLSKRMEHVKKEVMETMNGLYGEIGSFFTDSWVLSKRLTAAFNEACVARSKLEEELKPQLGGLVSKYEDVTGELAKTTVILTILSKLTAVHQSFQEADKARNNRDYVKLAKCIDKAGKDLLAMKVDCDESDLKIIRALKTDLLLRRERLIYDVNELWNTNVTWSTQTGNKKGTKETVLAITFTPRLAADVTKALTIVNYLNNTVRIFGANLVKLVLKPIVSFTCTVQTETEGKLCRLVVVSQTNKAEPTEVLNNVRLVFECLNDTFLKWDSPNIMNYLGELFAPQFCEDLINDCLNPAIPSDSKDLKTYTDLMTALGDLQDYLYGIGFLSAERMKILTFAKNVDILFANKRCQEKLARARDLMQQHLHVTVKVPENVPGTANVPENVIVKQEKHKKKSPEKEPVDNFDHEPKIKCMEEFPDCQVSKFVVDLIELLHGILHDAETGAPACAARMYYMTRHICDLFCDTVPLFHKDNIEMFPQQAAIHHNNCMYLAHNLLTLGHRYRRRIALPSETCLTYTDLVFTLRKVGTESFLQQMRRQREQLMEFLKEGNVFQDLSSESSLGPRAVKAIKRCLHLLTSLKEIWSPVLPQTVYLKAIGTLTNSCVEELTFTITRQEDITQKAAAQLNSRFETLVSEAPSLFQVNDERVLVQKYVPKWQRFVEVKLILVSSLMDIVDRWADGKGPLAVEFTAEEVKRMIRALFQNTDRRAAALSKIR